jgi:hypothetical protein
VKNDDRCRCPRGKTVINKNKTKIKEGNFHIFVLVKIESSNHPSTIRQDVSFRPEKDSKAEARGA